MKKRERIHILEGQVKMLENRIQLYRVHASDLGRRVEILECRADKARERRGYTAGTMVLSESAGLGEVHWWLDSLPDELEDMIVRACWWRNAKRS